MQSVFTITVRVYYEDTDAGGVVYYANYLKFMERARTEWLRQCDINHEELIRRDGVMFVVRSARMEFRKPARLDDVLEVDAGIRDYGGASITFAQAIRRAGVTLCEGETVVACLNATTLAPSRLPRILAARLKEVTA